MEQWLLEKKDKVAVLTVNRPDVLNSVTEAMYDKLPPILDELDDDAKIRVVIVRGAGAKAFVAGADVGEFEEAFGTPERAMAYDRRVEVGTSRLADLQKPTIAMIHGYALGTGVFLAAACDLRIVSDQARFSVPVARYGIIPSPPDLYRLARIVGYSFVLEMTLTGRMYSAHDALMAGLANQVVPADQLEEVTMSLAQQIAENAPLSLMAVRTLLRELMLRQAKPSIDDGAFWYDRVYSSEDSREGARAFQEKRPPHFRGE